MNDAEKKLAKENICKDCHSKSRCYDMNCCYYVECFLKGLRLDKPQTLTPLEQMIEIWR